MIPTISTPDKHTYHSSPSPVIDTTSPPGVAQAIPLELVVLSFTLRILTSGGPLELVCDGKRDLGRFGRRNRDLTLA